MKKQISLLAAVVAMTIAVAVALGIGGSVSAAPAGAATGLKMTAESCANNLASYRLTWSPSGKGAQRVDLSATNNGFSGNYSSGNLAANATLVDLTSLKPGTTYYTRIVTSTSGGLAASDTLSFTASCQTSKPFSVPTKLQASEVGKGTMRFKWTPGQGNSYFCLDTASNVSDLVQLKGTWRNHGCGTSVAQVDVSNLRCGTVVYWRVFAWGTDRGHSQPSVTSTQPCVIGAPTQLEAQVTGSSSVLLSWKPGAENKWFCVDVAKSAADLRSKTGSWRNYGCWTTGSSLQIANLECGTTYYWNVYAWNNNVNTRSTDSSFQVTGCTSTAKAPIEDLDIVKVGSRYYAEIVAALPDACHSEGTIELERSGNTFRITVLNVVEPGQCAFVYDTYKDSVNLGNLEAGRTYKVIVNGEKSETFVAS